ncbi:MAG: transglutaminase family protein [Cellvibrionaceae bacterium]
MRFVIQHHTHYNYSHNIELGPQLLRFYPRSDSLQSVISYQIQITPTPVGCNEYLDLEGNRVRQVWFDGVTSELDIQVNMMVDTHTRPKLEGFLAPQALLLPIQHEHDYSYVQAYLQRIDMDDSVTVFAAELSIAVSHQTLAFLNQLNHQLHNEFHQIHRDSGPPQTPAFTLQTRHGACRDLALLFVDCCRAEGVAARFVSGYQKGDTTNQLRHLHAWPEVYLPGAGWYAYDPTHGEAVSDTHVTIAAAAHPEDTMPVTGSYDAQGANSTLDYQINIQSMII